MIEFDEGAAPQPSDPVMDLMAQLDGVFVETIDARISGLME